MTVDQVVKQIEKRGFVVAATQAGDNVQLEVKKGDTLVPWPTLTLGKSGNVAGVALKSYHPVKVAGQNEHATVAIFGDVYLANAGRPSVADKAVAALLAPKPETEAPKDEAAKPEQTTEVAPVEVVAEAATKKGKKQHAAA